MLQRCVTLKIGRCESSSNITFRVKFFKTSLFRNCQKSLEHKENQTKYREMTRKPRSRVSILIYRTWWTISARERDQKASELIYNYITDMLAFSQFGLLTYLLSVSYLEAL